MRLFLLLCLSLCEAVNVGRLFGLKYQVKETREFALPSSVGKFFVDIFRNHNDQVYLRAYPPLVLKTTQGMEMERGMYDAYLLEPMVFYILYFRDEMILHLDASDSPMRREALPMKPVYNEESSC